MVSIKVHASELMSGGHCPGIRMDASVRLISSQENWMTITGSPGCIFLEERTGMWGFLGGSRAEAAPGTWPPPSGKSSVSSRTTWKPLSTSFWPPLPSVCSSAGRQETTVVVNCAQTGVRALSLLRRDWSLQPPPPPHYPSKDPGPPVRTSRA